MTTDLFQVSVMVLTEKHVIALAGRDEGRGHQERHEAMLGQLQLVNDVGTEKAQGVGEGGEPEAGNQLLGDGGTPNEVTALDDESVEPGSGQVGAVDEAVVAASDDDGVVMTLLGAGHQVLFLPPQGGEPAKPREGVILMLSSFAG